MVKLLSRNGSKVKAGDIVLWYDEFVEIRTCDNHSKYVLGIRLDNGCSGSLILRESLDYYPGAFTPNDLGKRFYVFGNPDLQFRRTIMRDGKLIQRKKDVG